MAVTLGRQARIKMGGVTVAKMTSMSFVIGNETIDITSFGDEWAKFARGMRNWTASVSGFYDKSDTPQNTLIQAAENGTKVTTIEFWINNDSTSYYDIDIVSDPEAGCYIDSFTVTADNNSVVAFDMSITGSGPVQYNGS